MLACHGLFLEVQVCCWSLCPVGVYGFVSVCVLFSRWEGVCVCVISADLLVFGGY